MGRLQPRWPDHGHAADPAPDGAMWSCGHPKTEANTKIVGKKQMRCRICRRKIERESFKRRHAHEQA